MNKGEIKRTRYVERRKCPSCGHLYTRTVAMGISHLYVNPEYCPKCKEEDLGLSIDRLILNPTRRDSK